MGKALYRYNPTTCRYEPVFLEGRIFWKKFSLLLICSSVLAIAGYVFTVRYFDSYDEIRLMQQNHELKLSWNILHQRIAEAQHQLDVLIQKDDHNYRVILDTNPLPLSIREAGTGGSENINLIAFADFRYLSNDHFAVERLKHQADVELQSFQELSALLDEKLVAWAARPAIQPISNSDLEKLHLTYGQRLHPIFKVWKDHKGLDFAAQTGKPVYATGDGTVGMAYYSDSYGKVIFIDHGHDFETRYAHLSDFAVSVGQRVRRGQLIGFVGNTGNSVAPHLHYEILFAGQHVNPLSFFQRDLSSSEYQKLIDAGSQNGISLD
ncbi:MAG TPA: M23 family metallopeptidase [Chryseosolibacter sp.]|nr:M23 family metallopeptidase [Chryseosolibacter sp.]